MQLVLKKIDELRPAPYNPRQKTEHVLTGLRESLKDYGVIQPIVINKHQCPECGDRRGIIIGGHRRTEALKANGAAEVECVELDLHIPEEKRANIRLNSQEAFDKKQFSLLLSELYHSDEKNTANLGLDPQTLADLLYAARYNANPFHNLLAEKFLAPPFSIFDAKQGYWQKRKNAWKEVLGDLAETRRGKLAKGDQNLLMMYGSGVSSFDPVVAEIAYSWFIPEKGGSIIDPFAGAIPRGGVAAALGYDYHGIEIRQEQIDANLRAAQRLNINERTHYYHGDAKDLAQLIPAGKDFDLLFTCPPYYDLEIYSEGEGDLSAKQTYAEFMEIYRGIFKQATDRLKDNRFAIVVVGDIRDERGFYRNFVADNIKLFEDLGLHLFNEIIYAQMLATAPHRAERNMRKRKVVKTHQNILTFYKGKEDLIKNPATLGIHEKILTFFKGDPEKIADTYSANPPVQRDAIPGE